MTLPSITAIAHAAFHLSSQVTVAVDGHHAATVTATVTTSSVLTALQNLRSSRNASNTAVAEVVAVQPHQDPGRFLSSSAANKLPSLVISATSTSSPGTVSSLIPHLVAATRSHQPAVVHVLAQSGKNNFSNSTAAASDARFAEVAAIRDTGAVVLNAPAHSAQAVFDGAVAAHRVAAAARVPVVNVIELPPAFDAGDAADLTIPELPAVPDEADAPSADNAKPKADSDSADAPLRPWYLDAASAAATINVDADAVASALATSVPSRPIQPVTYTGPAEPSAVIVAPASHAHVFPSPASDIGVVSVALSRPWPSTQFTSAIPASVQSIVVVDTVASGVLEYGPLFLDAVQHLGDRESIFFRNVRLAGDASTLDEASAQSIIDSARQPSQQQVTIIRNSDSVPNGIVNGSQAASPFESVPQDAIAKAVDETPYAKMLRHLLNERLYIANSAAPHSLYGSPNASGDDTTNPAFQLGRLLTRNQERDSLALRVATLLSDSASELPAELRTALADWLLVREDTSLAAVRAAQAAVAALERYAESSASDAVSSLLAQRDLFVASSNWIVAADDWAYDLGNSGLHHALASHANVNILVIDTLGTTDSNTNTTSSASKKDIGLYAMNYGGTYVASVAAYASYSQTLQALKEAAEYNGPSVVAALLPHDSEYGFGGRDFSPLEALRASKIAVDSGRWPLYRWDPRLVDTAENVDRDPFTLDSAVLKGELAKFLSRENDFSVIARKEPRLSANVASSVETAVSDARTAHEHAAKQASLDALLGGLASGPPVLILFGSDGHNGGNVAKRLSKEAASRGLSPRVLTMNDFAVDELPLEERVLFVVSTAGQGEFPLNAREFWKNLENASGLALGSTSTAVFGLGDSKYWPGDEGPLYFNKPARDLADKLEELGARPLLPPGLGDDQDSDSYEAALRAWLPDLWTALGVAGAGSTADVDPNAPKPITEDEANKHRSNFMRGTIMEGLLDESTGALAESDTKLTKFHGIYQQDDRDLREERLKQKLEPAYSFMVRVRLPGGVASPQQWIQMDDIANSHANGTLRITTRQTYQLHGVLKRNLRGSIREINRALMDTLAACGDVNRNVICNANPYQSHVHAEVHQFATKLSEHLLPRTSSYHEIWLSDKLVAGNAVQDVEPLYGPTYLPRKFKVAISVPPANDADVFAHDLGYIAILDENQEKLLGYNVTIGGGMGMTHSNKKTYPRVADVLGFCTPEQAIDVGEKVMLVQRDFGDRTNRKHARLKYTLDDLGMDFFKAQIEERLGYQLEEPRPYEFTENGDRFGWTKGVGDKWHFTMYIQSGRVADFPGYPLKTNLRELAAIHKGTFRMTCNQNLIIADVAEADLDDMKAHLKRLQLDNIQFSALRLNSIACVALPTCGLAMAESERYLPRLITLLDQVIDEAGLHNDAITIRMTGCPNGCARPYIAEIAFVGKSMGAYNVYLGGGFAGNRLGKLFKESLKEDAILKELTPIIKRYAVERQEGERFGDFVIRVGIVKATRNGLDFHD